MNKDIFVQMLECQSSLAFNNESKFLDFSQKLGVLDFGCGTGSFTSKIAKKFPATKFTAFDIDEDYLN